MIIDPNAFHTKKSCQKCTNHLFNVATNKNVVVKNHRKQNPGFLMLPSHSYLSPPFFSGSQGSFSPVSQFPKKKVNKKTSWPLVGNFREVSSPIYQPVKVEGPSFPTSRASQKKSKKKQQPRPQGSLWPFWEIWPSLWVGWVAIFLSAKRHHGSGCFLGGGEKELFGKPLCFSWHGPVFLKLSVFVLWSTQGIFSTKFE